MISFSSDDDIETLNDKIEQLQARNEIFQKEVWQFWDDYQDKNRKIHDKIQETEEIINLLSKRVRLLQQRENKRILNRCITLDELLTTDQATRIKNIREMCFYTQTGTEIWFPDGIPFRWSEIIRTQEEEALIYAEIARKYDLPHQIPSTIPFTVWNIDAIRELIKKKFRIDFSSYWNRIVYRASDVQVPSGRLNQHKIFFDPER